MTLLLNPRVLIALALAGLLAFTHLYAYRSGANHVRLEWEASVSAANDEARRMEALRQSRVDEASRSAVARESRILAESAGAADAVRRLRDAIASKHSAEESAAAAAQRATTAGELLVESAEAYRQLAATCDRHVSDLKMLLEAWPR